MKSSIEINFFWWNECVPNHLQIHQVKANRRGFDHIEVHKSGHIYLAGEDSKLKLVTVSQKLTFILAPSLFPEKSSHPLCPICKTPLKKSQTLSFDDEPLTHYSYPNPDCVEYARYANEGKKGHERR